jgi:hypothetical protein
MHPPVSGQLRLDSQAPSELRVPQGDIEDRVPGHHVSSLSKHVHEGASDVDLDVLPLTILRLPSPLGLDDDFADLVAAIEVPGRGLTSGCAPGS